MQMVPVTRKHFLKHDVAMKTGRFHIKAIGQDFRDCLGRRVIRNEPDIDTAPAVVIQAGSASPDINRMINSFKVKNLCYLVYCILKQKVDRHLPTVKQSYYLLTQTSDRGVGVVCSFGSFQIPETNDSIVKLSIILNTLLYFHINLILVWNKP